MVRKETTSTEQIAATRTAQAMAAVRRLSRKIDTLPNSGYRDFLMACRVDVQNALDAPEGR